MGKTLAQARIEIENLPSHDIGGYEWECYSCHSHWQERFCQICGRDGSKQEHERFSEFDEKGNECGHEDLIDRKLVLKLMGASDE